MIEHVRILEEYLDAIPDYGEKEIEQMQKDTEGNRQIIQCIAECEQASGKEVSLIRDLQVFDHRTRKDIANITLAASIQRKSDQSIPLRVVLDFRNNRMITAASILTDSYDNENNANAGKDSPTETASIGVQADIPFPLLYGNRDEEVYQRDKFRPEEIDPYGRKASTSDGEITKESTTDDYQTKNIQFEDVSSDEGIITGESSKEPEKGIENSTPSWVAIKEERQAAQKARMRNQKICELEEKEKQEKKRMARARSREQAASKEAKNSSSSGMLPENELTGRMRPAAASQDAVTKGT